MSLFSDWLSLRVASAPTAAIEVASNLVCGAALEVSGGRATVTAHAVDMLPDGVLQPSLTAANVQDRRMMVTALRKVLEGIGRPRRIALLLPDTVAKVSLVRFEKTPGAKDLDQLIRWQVRKAAPFPIEDAQVSYVRGATHPDGQEYLVTLARRDVIQEYESVCEEAGAQAGLVDLATFNVVNAVLAGGVPGGDWLLVNVAPDSSSIVILRGGDVIFYRNRATEGEGTLADLVHQTAMYYQDRLQGSGFARILLGGAAAAASGRQAGDVERMRKNLEQRLAMPVETVDPRTAVTLADRIGAGQALLDALAPVVGAVLRGRSVAA